MDKLTKHYSAVLQFTIVCLGGVLFWFAFVYYPKIVSDIKQGKGIVNGSSVFKPVSAASYTFPIVTETYRIEYDRAGNVYTAAIAGADLAQFVYNRDNAKLALKTATSMDDLCGVDVVYVSSEGLEVPGQYRGNGDC